MQKKYCAQEPLDFRYENEYLRDGADYTARAAKTIQKVLHFNFERLAI